MPRFFDDYSNTYLTHDSAAGRKQQRRGWKFRENFRLHYEKYVDDWRKGPMGLASAQQAFIKAKGRDDPIIPPLPDGWTEQVDDATNMVFFCHEATGKRSWVRPAFIPPPPGPVGGGGPPLQSSQGNFRGGPPGGGGGFRGGPPGGPPGGGPRGPPVPPGFYGGGGPPPSHAPQFGGPHPPPGAYPPGPGGPIPPYSGGPHPPQYGGGPPKYQGPGGY